MKQKKTPEVLKASEVASNGDSHTKTLRVFKTLGVSFFGGYLFSKEISEKDLNHGYHKFE